MPMNKCINGLSNQIKNKIRESFSMNIANKQIDCKMMRDELRREKGIVIKIKVKYRLCDDIVILILRFFVKLY
jgi:pyrimidine operon attenuation protein/uracil phosphoribosyltransferase